MRDELWPTGAMSTWSEGKAPKGLNKMPSEERLAERVDEAHLLCQFWSGLAAVSTDRGHVLAAAGEIWTSR